MSDEIRYGGFWRRFFALIVDTVIWYAFFFCFVLLVFPAGFIYLTETGGIVGNFPEFESILIDATTGSDFTYYASPLVNFAASLIFTLMLIGYFAGMESSSRQATYGKMMFGLKVTDQHTFRIGFWHAFGRYFAKALSVLTIFIGFLMAAFTEKKQALHDMVCKTLVIREGSCFIWPAFKVILLSILFTVLVFAGAGVYTYTKYGDIFYGETEARKKIATKIVIDFFGMDMSAPDKLAEGDKQKESADLQDHEAPAPTEETFDLENNNDAASLNVQLKESFHDNGVKKMEAHYVDGKLNGSSTLWNEYGQKIIIVNYKEDQRHGLLTRWHNNGQKKIEINYIDNKRDGEMTFWHENGDVKKILTYSNGELIEKEKEYD